MPHLRPPTVRAHASFLDALDELQPEGLLPDLDRGRLRDREQFAAYVRGAREQALSDAPRPHGWAPATHLWWVAEPTDSSVDDGADGDAGPACEYLGTISIRHSLATDYLASYGGHIGYHVRPSARCRGHATGMLAAVLPVAAELGIDEVLVTCDTVNLPSRRVIERNGGRFENELDGKLRFWLPTS